MVEPVPQQDEQAAIPLILDMINESLNKSERYSDLEILESARQYLNDYPPDLIAEIAAVANSGSRSVRRKISDMVRNGADPVRIHEAAYFLPLVNDHAFSVEEHVCALHENEFLPSTDNFVYAEPMVRQQCVAIVSVAAAIDGVADVMRTNPLRYSGETGLSQIRDKRIIKLMIDHPEKHPMVASFILERMTVDYDAIAELVVSDSIALGEGIL